jgi:hypothetical protein
MEFLMTASSDVGLAYRQVGRKGLESVENVGPRLMRT